MATVRQIEKIVGRLEHIIYWSDPKDDEEQSRLEGIVYATALVKRVLDSWLQSENLSRG